MVLFITTLVILWLVTCHQSNFQFFPINNFIYFVTKWLQNWRFPSASALYLLLISLCWHANMQHEGFSKKFWSLHFFSSSVQITQWLCLTQWAMWRGQASKTRSIVWLSWWMPLKYWFTPKASAPPSSSSENTSVTWVRKGLKQEAKHKDIFTHRLMLN